MPRKPKPTTVVISGRRREVLDRTPSYWVEREPDGSLTVHAGKLLDGQEPGKLLDEAKPCSVCKEPAITATKRGRAVHPTCEGWTDWLTDQMHARIVSGVAADLGATIITSKPHRDHPREADRRAA